ncbi:MAG: Isoprenyl transferase [Actinobacteria bacterium]|nr:Isoprenyl transferase [Actinomycetota bacterium]
MTNYQKFLGKMSTFIQFTNLTRRLLGDKEESLFRRLDRSRIPQHVAIIMDGNGRWAQKRGLPRIAGHREGIEAIRRILKIAVEIGVRYLTLFSFSTENWNRPEVEIDGLMELFREAFKRELDELNRNGVRLRAIGHCQKFPPDVYRSILEAEKITKDNNRLFLYLAVGYGGRDEIVDATRKIVDNVVAGKIHKEEIDKELFQRYLYAEDCPDPDLLIRTSGELRISNFLLWQVAYSEFYFTETLWPDFDRVDFLKAIISFQKRKRRYGGADLA